MQTTHTLLLGDARALNGVADASVQLVVTSPPYPMIAMWDEVFRALAPDCGAALDAERGFDAFEAMHRALDLAWAESARALVPGGFLCVNIGDATRSLAGEMALYPNHARIIAGLLRLNLTPLPDILWRKPTNAPNKFMGSGMLPAGAYVTYEHEYILVFRKGGKRVFSASERENRQRSAFFWEERNLWFSDLWTDLRGAGQALEREGLRARSAAFPLELPARLIAMFSLYGDTVLDPFVGTGTTMAAALASGRSSVGVERAPELAPLVRQGLLAAVALGQRRARERLAAHRAFVEARLASGKELAHRSRVYGFPVMTSQELALELLEPTAAREEGGRIVAAHAPLAPQGSPQAAPPGAAPGASDGLVSTLDIAPSTRPLQESLFSGT